MALFKQREMFFFQILDLIKKMGGFGNIKLVLVGGTGDKIEIIFSKMRAEYVIVTSKKNR